MIAENILTVRNNISQICTEAGRSSDEVKLIAVSKTMPPESVIEAMNNGITDFGENKAQELKSKSADCPESVKWHFIGHLQKNKVKDVVKIAELIHSVESIKLADEINKRAGNINKLQKILLEVNTSGEESKFGLRTEDEILNLAGYCRSLDNVELIGLMTMAPWTDDENVIRNSFVSLKNIFIKLNEKEFGLNELSMGMTNDYKIALEEGATILRIGTAIFGKR